MARYDDPFKGHNDIYKELTNCNDIFKDVDPYREMKEMMAVGDPLKDLRGVDLSTALYVEDGISQILERERRSQLNYLASLHSEWFDITRQAQDLLKAALASSFSGVDLEAAKLGLSQSLAQALVEPMPTHVTDWVRTNAGTSVAAESYQISSVLERLTHPSEIAFAARVVVGDTSASSDRRTPEDKNEADTDSSEESRKAEEGEESESPQQYSDLALPEEVQQRLHVVGYIPLEVHYRIARDHRALYDLTPRQFEEYVADLLRGLGFEDIVLTPQSGDGGRDLMATKRIQGIPILFAIECKKYKPDHHVGPQIMRALLGTVQGRNTTANKGVLVTTSYFTKASKDLIITEPLLDGKDFDDLCGWVHEFSRKLRL